MTLKVSIANDLTPQSDEVATSMDPSCPSDSSACGSDELVVSSEVRRKRLEA